MRVRRACDRARCGRTRHACASAVPLPRCVAHAHTACARSRSAGARGVRARPPSLAQMRRVCARGAHAIAHSANARGLRARARRSFA
eukprot:2116553-Pleurochrysis_carterae.AAC.1